jgi:hypothetical protein
VIQLTESHLNRLRTAIKVADECCANNDADYLREIEAVVEKLVSKELVTVSRESASVFNR